MPVYGDTAELYSNYSSNNNTRLVYCSWGTPLPTIESAGGTAPTGYTFKEWNTNTSGTGTSYAPGDTTPSVNFLYAIWEEIPYDVTISYKGSTIATMSSSGTKTLNTAGTYCEDDITIDYTKTGITVVETLDSHGGTIVNISGDPVTSLQAKTVIPTSQSQTISADSGYDAISEVLVQGDSNLISSNIASGISIFGVVGTFTGGGGGSPKDFVEQHGTMTSFTDGTVSTVGAGAFAYCSSLTTVSLPSCTIISSYAFSYCPKLTTVSFPSCTTIGSYAFYNCYSLTTVSFPLCTSISAYAFASCSKLTTASFPSCTSISNRAFANCSNLTTADFPLCTIISPYAFSYCSNLTTADFPLCSIIQSYAFAYCYCLLSLYLTGSSIVILTYSNAFLSTPIAGYTTSTGGVYGSIFVPSSLYNTYITSTNWVYFSSRFVSV